MLAGDNAGAKRIFLLNAKLPRTSGRSTSARRAPRRSTGNNAQAIAYARKAIAQAPDEGNKKNLE